jgi:hypothetical protein
VTVGVAGDPAVVGRVGHDCREHRGVSAGLGVPGEDSVERLGREQRSVAVHDQHGAGEVRCELKGEARRVPGTALLLLYDDLGSGRRVGEELLDLRTLVTEHDQGALSLQRLDRREHVTEKRAPAHRVHHLGSSGLHPLALPSREHKHGGRTDLSHSHS